MSDINNLANSIDAEFTAVAEKTKGFQTAQLAELRERQQRLTQLGKVFEELSSLWKPRLELLLGKFGDRAKVTPTLKPSAREATFEFRSELARIRLRFSAYTDRDVKNVVLAYDLEIIPVLMHFTPHVECAFPLNAIDQEAVAKWLDERIVEFVRTYLALGENNWYLKDQMVEDPVAQVRFPKQAAAATLEWNGTTYYFIGEETRREFATQHKVVF